jgi:glycosyltransferase involved in cell wall biosynthesis
MVEIDILIPTFGRTRSVNNTLLQLLDQDTLPSRIIVVNQTQGVIDAECEVRQAYDEAGLELIWINRASPNVMAAQNAALLAASSDICLILDDDIIPPRHLVRMHWNRHQDGKGWVAVGGQVWHRLPDVEVGQLSLDQPESGTIVGHDSSKLTPGGPLFGGNWSVRREVVLALGGWDESFVGSANYQEADLINRLRIGGYPFVWDPAIWLIHLRLPSGGCRIPGSRLFPEWTKSTNFFLYKYRYPEDIAWREILPMALRAGPLRKENVLKPWNWPGAWAAFVKGWWRGRVKAANPIYPLLGIHAGSDIPAGQRLK